MPDEITTTVDLAQWGEVLLILAIAILANVLVGVLVRVLTHRAVRRALSGRGRWRSMRPRRPDGLAHSRRAQRANATAKMFARLLSLLIAAIAALSISRSVGIDPLVAISSAGFVGAAFAIGGQSIIKDWLYGLLVLLEDRYAEGDKVTMKIIGNPIEGTVEGINSMSVRLQLADGSLWHAGHGTIESVNNHSQGAGEVLPAGAMAAASLPMTPS